MHTEESHWRTCSRLWKGIEDSTQGWTICVEQTVEGLQGLPQPEDQIDSIVAWDEVTDMHLEGEEMQANADMTRQDAWAVS